MVSNLKDYKVWLAMIFIGLLIAITVRIIAEAASGDANRLTAMQNAIDRLQAKQHPATSRRFTADHGLELIGCVRLPDSEEEACLEALEAKLKP